MNYAVVFEQTENNFSAYVPDLPGCVATGATLDECRRNITLAIQMHLKGMEEDHLPLPERMSLAEMVRA